MHKEGEEVHAEGDEARAGSTPNIVRWILGISLLAAILLLSAIWIFGAATTEEEDRVATTTDRLENADEGNTTDSIVSGEEEFEFGETTPAEGPAVEGDAGSQAAPAPE